MARCGDSLVISVAPQEERKNNDMMLEEKEKIETSSHLCSADFAKANDSAELDCVHEEITECMSYGRIVSVRDES
ncbi:unnamed protein product [Onchocerca ochengi]|uniref:Uncharacterized protein n=1 Tax=Onchocerca ochengi TaxID=42157 RepID=A0A182EGP6_ONCOC|nr:unnamed protein product [Onchocerca ochengi]